MKILFQYYYGGGGALENFLNLLTAMIEDDSYSDHFIIVCHKDSKLNYLSKYKNVTVLNPYSSLPKEVGRLCLGLFGLKNIVNIYKPDVVWSLNLGSYISLPVRNILSLNNAHQVYPFKDTVSHPGGRFRVTLLRFFFRCSLSKVDLILTQTETMASYVRAINYNINIAVVPKVVEVSFKSTDLRKNQLSVLSNAFSKKLLYVATDYEHKNHIVLFYLMIKFRDLGEKVSLILTITEEQAKLIGGEQVDSLISEGYVVCLGWVEKNQLKSLYDMVNICVMPSKLESLSSSHLEALSWNKPQVVSDFPFSREICGDAAIYVNADSVDEWYDAISQLLVNEELVYSLLTSGEKQLDRFPRTWLDMSKSIRKFFKNSL